jgi:hypothetical protein
LINRKIDDLKLETKERERALPSIHPPLFSTLVKSICDFLFNPNHNIGFVGAKTK